MTPEYVAWTRVIQKETRINNIFLHPLTYLKKKTDLNESSHGIMMSSVLNFDDLYLKVNNSIDEYISKSKKRMAKLRKSVSTRLSVGAQHSK